MRASFSSLFSSSLLSLVCLLLSFECAVLYCAARGGRLHPHPVFYSSRSLGFLGLGRLRIIAAVDPCRVLYSALLYSIYCNSFLPAAYRHSVNEDSMGATATSAFADVLNANCATRTALLCRSTTPVHYMYSTERVNAVLCSRRLDCSAPRYEYLSFPTLYSTRTGAVQYSIQRKLAREQLDD